MTKYAVRVTSKKVMGDRRTVMTEAGKRFWIITSDFGPTATHWEDPPKDVCLFDDPETAREFAEGWPGHPWWVKPKSFEIVPMEPVYDIVSWAPAKTETSVQETNSGEPA